MSRYPLRVSFPFVGAEWCPPPPPLPGLGPHVDGVGGPPAEDLCLWGASLLASGFGLVTGRA